MNFDLFEHRLLRDGYSEKPMTFLDPEPNAMLSAVTGIALIETGSRSARERWQTIQLRNLINHVSQRSAFWRARIGSRKASDVDLAKASDPYAAGLAYTGRLRRLTAASSGWIFDQFPCHIGVVGSSSQFFCLRFQCQLQFYQEPCSVFPGRAGPDFSIERGLLMLGKQTVL